MQITFSDGSQKGIKDSRIKFHRFQMDDRLFQVMMVDDTEFLFPVSNIREIKLTENRTGAEETE